MKSLLVQERKAQSLNLLVPIILTLVIAAVILVFGVIVTQGATDLGYKDTSATATKELVGPVNETGNYFANYRLRNVVCTISAVVNNSGAVAISATNYTQTNCFIRISTAGEDKLYNNTRWNVTYSYRYDAATDATQAGNKTVLGLGTFADYWEIIILAIVISIVISLLLVLFAAKRRAQ